MLEEEKEAIEYFINQKEIYIDTQNKFKKDIEDRQYLNEILNELQLDIDNIEIVLNLIEKQQKEIEKRDKIINKMSEYLSIIRDCPNEDIDANLDCEKRCNDDDNLYAECWKLYFENKVKE